MYCGDETGAFVGDLGHTTSRFGYGGVDCPKSVVPSWTLPGGTTSTDGSSDSATNSTSVSRSKSSKTKSLACPGSTLKLPPGVASAKQDIVPIFDWSKSGSCDPNNYLGASGVVQNWDAYESAWTNAFQTLRVWDGKKHTTGGRGGEEEGKCIHPVLAVDAGHTCYGRQDAKERDDELKAGMMPTGPPDPDERQRLRQRSKVMELLFEKFDAPAVFIAPSPMLAAFAHGRQTALVVDVGGAGARVTPIIDGLVLRSAQRRSGRGGEWLGSVQAKALTDYCGASDIVPRYALGGPIAAGRGRKRTVTYGPESDVRKSIFHRVAVSDLMYEMLTGDYVTLPTWRSDLTVPFVGYKGEKKRKRGEGEEGDDEAEMETAEDDAAASASAAVAEDDAGDDEVEGTSYTLPDGTKVDLAMSRPGKDLCRLPELLYTDEVPFVSLSQETSTAKISVAQSTLSSLPLQRLTHASLTAVGDGDARKELCGNILLTGAASLYPNMEARLSYEISNIAPSAYKCKVVASRNSVERRYAPWIGGSILTSLGSFQQLWLSKAEYEEYGATMGSNRFP